VSPVAFFSFFFFLLGDRTQKLHGGGLFFSGKFRSSPQKILFSGAPQSFPFLKKKPNTTNKFMGTLSLFRAARLFPGQKTQKTNKQKNTIPGFGEISPNFSLLVTFLWFKFLGPPHVGFVGGEKCLRNRTYSSPDPPLQFFQFRA